MSGNYETLHPNLQTFMETVADAPLALHDLPVPVAREISAQGFAIPESGLDKVAQTKHISVEGPNGPIPVELTYPEGEGPHPMIVFFHGGGFTLGTVEQYRILTHKLTKRLGVIVASVEYRLSPEHPFPQPLEDCYAALQWALTADDLGATDVGVMGDSAGGNMAAVCCHLAKERGGKMPAFQVLLYPCTDASVSFEGECLDQDFLTAESMEFFWDNYLQGTDANNPHISPVLATDCTGLPRALVVVAEHDPLKEEGRAYANKLQQCDVIEAQGMIHLFLSFPFELPKADEVITQIGQWLFHV